MPFFNTRFVSGLVAGGLLAASFALSGCSDEASATIEPRPQPVRVATVTVHPQQSVAKYTGVIRPRYESDLGFRVGGKLVARLVDVGERVSEGQPIARLDETDLALGVASGEAERDAALSSLRQAKAEVERYNALFDKRFVSAAALDRTVTARDEARSRLDRAEQSLTLAENQQRYAVLAADRAGVVSELFAEVGQVVSAGQPVARISREDALDAVVAIPEQKRGDVADMKAAIEIWGREGEALPATLREIAPDADAASRTYEARFTIDTDDPALAFGRTVTLSLSGVGGRDVADIPLSAVLNDGKGPVVFVLDAAETTVRRMPVELVRLTDTSAVIGKGLSDGDRIVTLGLHKLDPQLPVHVVEDTAQRVSSAR